MTEASLFSQSRGLEILPRNQKDTLPFEAAEEEIKAAMNDRSFSPLATRKDIVRLARKSHAVEEVFEFIQSLAEEEGIKHFDEVPGIEEFCVIDSPYIGADGKERHPLPKYLPNHIAPHLARMCAAYEHFLENEYDTQATSLRPGLIVQSAYRSPYYQMGVIARSFAASGIEKTLQTVSLPGISEHSNYKNCAIDFNNIGDAEGHTLNADGNSVDFSETVEFKWLLEHAPQFGFWFSYFPDPADPGKPTGAKGMLVEPWHLQYVEDAEQKMQANNVRELFAVRMQLLKGART